MYWTAFESTSEMTGFVDPDHGLSLSNPVMGGGDRNPEVMIVKRSPSYADLKGGKALLGKDGLPLRKALFNAGVSYYATNAFPFVTKEGKVPIKDARAAAGILSEEIRRVNPKRIMLLGADAARWTEDFTVPFKRHSEVIGRVFEVDDRYWRVTKAAGALVNVPSEYRQFVEDVRELLLYGTEQQETPKQITERYTTVKFPAVARQILAKMPKRVALDVETTGLDPYTCELLTIQVSWQEGMGYAFPFEIFRPEEWAEILSGRDFVFQNGTYDVKVLANNGIFVSIAEDTTLQHSLIDETPGTHSMEVMANRYLKIDKWSEMVDYDNMKSVPLEVLGRYGARDTDLTLRLANKFKPAVEGRYINTLLHRAQNSITRSELRGVRVDREAAETMAREIDGKLHESAQRMEEEYGLGNANSPKQVLEVLLDQGVPLEKKKGKYSTNEESISPWEEQFPVVRAVLNHRHLTKARSTYLENLLTWSQHDGRYHPDFRLAGTETGRLTEKFITLVPRGAVDDDPTEGRLYQSRLRELFIPDEGHVLIGADYSGLELVMAAHLSQDPALMDDIRQGRDTHGILAVQAFNLPIDLEPMATLKERVNEKYEHQRFLAKSITFGFLFGSSGMSMTKYMSLDDAEQLIDTLKRRYPRLTEWQEEIRQQARKGYVETPWGRRRHFYYDSGLNANVIAKQDRECINFPIQGHSSDMTLEAFTRLEMMGVQTLFPVHDAIYVQAREDEAEKVLSLVKRTMESIIPDSVPFRADAKIGASWADV